ncbi:MAG: response regulator [Candidatus Omnitrophica bacterium]|nr:response regulator [Candidatus Omnitrophota bacterium]
MNTILVIDDEIQIVEILEQFLSSEGFKVETAYNGREGLEKLDECHPDIILLDEKMPEVGGAAFRQGMQKLGKDIPVIVLTGSVGVGQKKDNNKQEYGYLLFKPVRLSDLKELILEILSQ